VTGAWLIQVVGAVVVFAVLQDVFFTVLFPASGHGLLRRPLTRRPWKAPQSQAAGSFQTGRRRPIPTPTACFAAPQQRGKQTVVARPSPAQ